MKYKKACATLSKLEIVKFEKMMSGVKPITSTRCFTFCMSSDASIDCGSDDFEERKKREMA